MVRQSDGFAELRVSVDGECVIIQFDDLAAETHSLAITLPCAKRLITQLSELPL